MASIVTIEQMRLIEAEADSSGLTYAELMDRAGNATAGRVLGLVEHIENPRITMLVGKGNNGGDGLVAARYLSENAEIDLRLYLVSRFEDSFEPFRLVREIGLFLAYADDDRDSRVLRHMVASADLIVDALFGIGIRLPIKGPAERILRVTRQALRERSAALKTPPIQVPSYPSDQPERLMPRVLAVDCPSGLECDTGEIDPNAIKADETITFIAPKPGLLAFPGANHVGRLTIANLSVPTSTIDRHSDANVLITSDWVRQRLPSRAMDSNKGSFGKVLLIGGSTAYSGAIGLSATAAYRSGCGLVNVASPGQVVSRLATTRMEPIWTELPDIDGQIATDAFKNLSDQIGSFDAIVIGPGMGQHTETENFVSALLQHLASHANKSSSPIVIDADGLNLMAKQSALANALPAQTILTPHPGEMARLCGVSTQAVQSDRVNIAKAYAAEWSAIVLLKGAHTVIANPSGGVALLPFKTDALSTAGTGDVLAGVIGGLLAQGMAPFEAAAAGGYIHGLSGVCAAEKLGSSRAVIASDVLGAIPRALATIE